VVLGVRLTKTNQTGAVLSANLTRKSLIYSTADRPRRFLTKLRKERLNLQGAALQTSSTIIARPAPRTSDICTYSSTIYNSTLSYPLFLKKSPLSRNFQNMSSKEGQSPAKDPKGEETKQEPPSCPKCKSPDDLVPIIFGYPSPVLLEMSKRGEVVLGGCCPPRPGQKMKNMHCKKCKENV